MKPFVAPVNNFLTLHLPARRGSTTSIAFLSFRMTFEPRDYVLVLMGASFGAILVLTSGLSISLAVAAGAPIGTAAAACLCLLMKTRLGGDDR